MKLRYRPKKRKKNKNGWNDSWQRPPVFLALGVHLIPRCFSSQEKVWVDRKPYGVNASVWRLLRRRIIRDLTAHFVPVWHRFFFSLYRWITANEKEMFLKHCDKRYNILQCIVLYCIYFIKVHL